MVWEEVEKVPLTGARRWSRRSPRVSKNSRLMDLAGDRGEKLSKTGRVESASRGRFRVRAFGRRLGAADRREKVPDRLRLGLRLGRSGTHTEVNQVFVDNQPILKLRERLSQVSLQGCSEKDVVLWKDAILQSIKGSNITMGLVELCLKLSRFVWAVSLVIAGTPKSKGVGRHVSNKPVLPMFGFFNEIMTSGVAKLQSRPVRGHFSSKKMIPPDAVLCLAKKDERVVGGRGRGGKESGREIRIVRIVIRVSRVGATEHRKN
jgi:hypothetical protein